MDQSNYIEINRNSWNTRTDHHFDSEFYDVEGFKKGKTSLNEIELNLLEELKGKKVLHLQCHFGQDTLSLARLGAKVTGVDLSNKAIDKAIELAAELNIEANFICCDLYDLPNHLDEKFDIIFTSYGTIGWLPDLDKWANLISHYLKPEGRFYLIEFHPVVWMFDDDFQNIKYTYHNSGPIEEIEEGTYAEKEADISCAYVSWNHGMSEVINSLIQHGLEINSLDEYDYSPYNCFNNTIKIEERKYRIKHLENKIPMVYAVVATKK